MSARAARAAARSAQARIVDGWPSTDAPPDAVCYICLERGTEPMVRNCACRGPAAGFAHLECLVQYAVAAAGTNSESRWRTCGLCKQLHYSAVELHLARARWERARGRAEGDEERLQATTALAQALTDEGNGDLPVALSLFEEVLRVRRREDTDREMPLSSTRDSIHCVALTQKDMGAYDKALPLAEELLAANRNWVASDREARDREAADHGVHPSIHEFDPEDQDMWKQGEIDMLSACHLLSHIYCSEVGEDTGEGSDEDEHVALRKALQLAREALAGRRRILGNIDVHTISSMAQLATILDKQDDEELQNDEALQLYEDCLRSTRQLMGSEHPDTYEKASWVGEARCRLGDYARGLPLLRAAANGWCRTHGDNHCVTKEAKLSLAVYEEMAAEQEETMYDRLAKRRRMQPRT